MRMAGKSQPRSKSPIVKLTLLLLAGLSLLFLILFSLRSNGPYHPNPNPIYRPETSFVTSLERFLEYPPPPSETMPFHDPKHLDDLIFKTETNRLYSDPFGFSPLRVYVYDMPSKFTANLLRLFISSYKETSNLTSNGGPVHRLVEQHSVDYWLWSDLISPEHDRLVKSVVRVHKQEEADLFYIPFFTTIPFFLMETQQCKSQGLVRL